MVSCSSVDMTPDVSVSASDPDQANIVFLRSSPFNYKEITSVYEVTGQKLQFIGLLNNDTRLTYTVAPGHHLFLVASSTVDYMRAEIEAGRVYYAIVAPGIGARTRQFSIFPV